MISLVNHFPLTRKIKLNSMVICIYAVFYCHTLNRIG